MGHAWKEQFTTDKQLHHSVLSLGTCFDFVCDKPGLGVSAIVSVLSDICVIYSFCLIWLLKADKNCNCNLMIYAYLHT